MVMFKDFLNIKKKFTQNERDMFYTIDLLVMGYT